MWARLRLRNRIILSYALILTLMLLLAGYLIVQLRELTQRTAQIEREVSATVRSSAVLTTDIASLRQTVNQYLFTPTAAQEERVRTVFTDLNDDLNAARRDQTAAVDINQIRSILPLLAAYEQDFQALVSLLSRQSQEVATIKESLFEAGGLLAAERGAIVAAASDPARATEQIDRVEGEIRRASLWAIFTAGSGNPEDLRAEAAALQQAKVALDPLLDEAQGLAALSKLNRVATLLNQAAIGMQSYATNLELRQQYETNVRAKDERLQFEADGLSQAAERLLTRSTAALTARSVEAQRLAAGAFISVLLLAILVAIGLAQTITRPLKQVVDAIGRMQHSQAAQQIASRDQSEVGQLARAFNQLVDALSAERSAVRQQQAALTERNSELEGALGAVRAAQSERDEMARTIRNVSVPILPILDRVVLVPLVGELDHERAEALTERMLRGVETYRARLIILDVTGVPLIDSHVAQWLIHAIEAARLLGASCTMVGITPEVAQTLVATGIDLSMIHTQADLQTAIEGVAQGRGATPRARGGERSAAGRS